MRYLGIDFGLKRAGLAISEGNLASPWKVITETSAKKLSEKIYREITGNDFDKIVVGRPEGKMGIAVSKLVKFLKSKDVDIEEADETLSTKHASEIMIQLGVPKKKRRINDDFSAAIILQNFLDNVG
ncbi:Holliday junction resolvase RuvX [Candidatus Daviesbacteria bacterium]|nr:Holliday junction resolvase RuvX [Candidatus Daviesbacteria bacterium]